MALSRGCWQEYMPTFHQLEKSPKRRLENDIQFTIVASGSRKTTSSKVARSRKATSIATWSQPVLRMAARFLLRMKRLTDRIQGQAVGKMDESCDVDAPASMG